MLASEAISWAPHSLTPLSPGKASAAAATLRASNTASSVSAPACAILAIAASAAHTESPKLPRIVARPPAPPLDLRREGVVAEDDQQSAPWRCWRRMRSRALSADMLFSSLSTCLRVRARGQPLLLVHASSGQCVTAVAVLRARDTATEARTQHLDPVWLGRRGSKRQDAGGTQTGG